MTHTARWTLVGAVALAAAGTAATTALRRVEIVGGSMAPTLEPGDRLVLVPVRTPRVGDLVGVTDPREPARLMVKRVVEVGDDGVSVAGDDPAASTDSRHFGTVPLPHLRGRAVYRYAPPERTGRLGSRSLRRSR